MIEDNLLEDQDVQVNNDGVKKKIIINKINVIKSIVGNLEENQSLQQLMIDKLDKKLKDAEKLNETMLNLFRQNVTIDNFPEKIQREVQRCWHQKYDALLNLNEQSRKQIHAKNAIIKEKDYQINILQKKLIETEKILMDRDELTQHIYAKYLSLKNHNKNK